jgi:hypothetical protein
VSPGASQSAVETPERIYGVTAVEIGERPLAVAWGRLALTDPGHTDGAEDPHWTLDLETISYGLIDTQDCVIRMTLRDGRTLAGEALLVSTNGRLYHFESHGVWTGLDDREPAEEPEVTRP